MSPSENALLRSAEDPRREPAALPSFGDALASVLWDLGVRHAFGLVGGAIGPLCESLQRSPIRVMHFRHEGGAAFSALEASFASRRPVAVFVTTGPGMANALTGLQAARWDGAKVIVLSGTTSAAQRGRWATQETSAYTNPMGLYCSGEVFHYAHVIEHPAELGTVAARLALGVSRPEGFVAHVSVPIGLQTQPTERVEVPVTVSHPPAVGEAVLARLAEMIDGKSVVLWVGHGARHAAEEICALADVLGCPVMCSPRGKGIFPEGHAQFLGVTGLGGHSNVDRYLTEQRPDYVIVLGTRMGEPTSFWQPSFIPAKAFIHVDLDPTVPGRAFPTARTIAVPAEIREFVLGLLSHLPYRECKPRPVVRRQLEAPLAPRTEGVVRPRFLLETMQRVIVEGSDALVLTESGNAFAWGNHALRFEVPGRYRVSTGYGSMGHATAGVVGAAVGAGRKAVALVGDGAMLMNCEISTAVKYGVPAVWIVMNDARYGMVDQGMRAQGFQPVETEIPRADFVLMARAVGADGVQVRRESELEAALTRAMTAKGPFVVDVEIDPSEPGPWLKRITNLILQGARGAGAESGS